MLIKNAKLLQNFVKQTYFFIFPEILKRMKSFISLVGLFLFVCEIPKAQTQQFITPIQGEYLKDFYLVNYVDWADSSILDHNCGKKTYDGHQGTDFVIRNFKQMDDGVNIVAAEEGIVTYVVDSLFDRSKTAVSGGFGNYICIKHPSKYYTYYAHLKKNSAVVKVGDTVKAGDIIGQVGSSGYTSDPHLHFEVWYDSLYLVDPFQGNCGNPTTLWLDPLQYVHEFGIIDHDLSNFIPTLDTLKERLPSQKLFTTNDQVINYWIQGYGVFLGDSSKIKWYTPENTLWSEFDFKHTEELWYYYFWNYIDVPPLSEAGQWTVKYLVNNVEKSVDTFYVHNTTQTIDKLSDQIDYRIFQDASKNLNIQLSTACSQNEKFTLFDISGIQVFTDVFPSYETKHSVKYNTLYHAGFYVLKFENSQYPVKKIWIK